MNSKKARVVGLESLRGKWEEVRSEERSQIMEGTFRQWKGSEILKRLFLQRDVTTGTKCTHRVTAPVINQSCEGAAFKERIFKSSSHRTGASSC